MTDMTKVTINMPVELHAKLRDMAHADGISVTEMMRRAVALYRAMWRTATTREATRDRHLT